MATKNLLFESLKPGNGTSFAALRMTLNLHRQHFSDVPLKTIALLH
jgi:hypothetical protein